MVHKDAPVAHTMAAPTSGRAKADTAVDTAILRETIRKEEKYAVTPVLLAGRRADLWRLSLPGTHTCATTSGSRTP